MAKKDKGPGFQQAAGLIRYFDAEEDTNLKINPYIVLALTFGTGIFLLALGYFYKV
ncbi:MAG TPA: preprotein translocase subunit Sec61beta [Candidatus Thermoplasmatota archaeon]|nr:preprotein translocase subunit Sec61beta [Candidatus Thermoplasmatota archaeon]